MFYCQISSTMMRPTLLAILVVNWLLQKEEGTGFREKNITQNLWLALFAGSTDGTFLPPMHVCKSKNIYKELILFGTVNTVYNCTKDG